MTTGTLDQTFEFLIEGVEFVSMTGFNVPSLHLTAKLENGIPLRLNVHVESTTEHEANKRVNDFAQELYSRLLLQFARVIERSERPRTTHRSFTTSSTSPVTTTDQMITAKARIVRPRKALSQAQVDALARDVELRVIAPQPATSAQLYSAIAMYTVGVESSDTVTRFIVFYSALALAALFKAHPGRQSQIDQLMLGVRPSIPCSMSPRNTSAETLYTKLRNDLIHAEERGCDPQKAITEIEAHVADFQEVVSLVFQSL